jgi:hypothetical protein
MERWWPHVSEVRRVAFGASLRSPVGDVEEGYAVLDRLLPCVKLDPKGSSDFLSRINRRRPSGLGLPGLSVNRLSTWSVARQVLRSLWAGAGDRPVDQMLGTVCQLDLDINTVPEYDNQVGQEVLGPVFGELVELGAEVAAEGDIP